MRDFKCLSTIKSHNFHFDFATIISSAMKPSLEQLRLLGFWGTVTNHPWMVMKVLKISLFKNSETLSQRVYKTEKKTETCFMVFLEQNT